MLLLLFITFDLFLIHLKALCSHLLLSPPEDEEYQLQKQSSQSAGIKTMNNNSSSFCSLSGSGRHSTLCQPSRTSRTSEVPLCIRRNGSGSHVCASILPHLPPALPPLLITPLLPPLLLAPPVLSGIGRCRFIREELLSEWRPVSGGWVLTTADSLSY